MKQAVILLFFLTSIFSLSQEKKLQYGIQLFPNFSTGIPEKAGVNSEYYQGIETFVFSYSGGFQLDWNFAEKWTLSTGILFNQVGEKGKVIPADPYRGFLYPHQHRFKICSIELPININRTFGKHFLIEFGVSPAITILAKYGDDRFFYPGQMNKLYRNSVGIFTNLGVGYKTTVAKSDLKIMPYAQIGLLNGIYEFYVWPDMRFFSAGIKVSFVI